MFSDPNPDSGFSIKGGGTTVSTGWLLAAASRWRCNLIGLIHIETPKNCRLDFLEFHKTTSMKLRVPLKQTSLYCCPPIFQRTPQSTTCHEIMVTIIWRFVSYFKSIDYLAVLIYTWWSPPLGLLPLDLDPSASSRHWDSTNGEAPSPMEPFDDEATRVGGGETASSGSACGSATPGTGGFSGGTGSDPLASGSGS